VIRSFKHRGLKRLYERDDRSGIRADLVDKIERILTALDSAAAPRALDVPGYGLHALKGELKGVLVGYGSGELAHRFSIRRDRCF